jgi:hypothetical protein
MSLLFGLTFQVGLGICQTSFTHLLVKSIKRHMRSLDQIYQAQDELKVLNKEDNESTIESTSTSSSERPESCQFCRSLDFDLIFAFTFAVVVGFMLILIMMFWLNGVFAYEE